MTGRWLLIVTFLVCFGHGPAEGERAHDATGTASISGSAADSTRATADQNPIVREAAALGHSSELAHAVPEEASSLLAGHEGIAEQSTPELKPADAVANADTSNVEEAAVNGQSSGSRKAAINQNTSRLDRQSDGSPSDASVSPRPFQDSHSGLTDAADSASNVPHSAAIPEEALIFASPAFGSSTGLASAPEEQLSPIDAGPLLAEETPVAELFLDHPSTKFESLEAEDLQVPVHDGADTKQYIGSSDSLTGSNLQPHGRPSFSATPSSDAAGQEAVYISEIVGTGNDGDNVTGSLVAAVLARDSNANGGDAETRPAAADSPPALVHTGSETMGKDAAAVVAQDHGRSPDQIVAAMAGGQSREEEQSSSLKSGSHTDAVAPAAVSKPDGQSEAETQMPASGKVPVLSVPDESEPLPPFDEWKEKMLAQQKLQGDKYYEPSERPRKGGVQAKPHKMSNYASEDCGAKVVSKNPETGNANSVLNENMDDYLINPCSAKKWLVIELCDPVEIRQIDLGNMELFSSLPKNFTVYISSNSERYPATKEGWRMLGVLQASEERAIHTFHMPREPGLLYTKFVKIEINSHYGREHYCPLTVIRVYGSTMVDDYDDDDDDEVSGTPLASKSSSDAMDVNVTDESHGTAAVADVTSKVASHESSSSSSMLGLTETVVGIVKKVLGKSVEASFGNTQLVNTYGVPTVTTNHAVTVSPSKGSGSLPLGKSILWSCFSCSLAPERLKCTRSAACMYWFGVTPWTASCTQWVHYMLCPELAVVIGCCSTQHGTSCAGEELLHFDGSNLPAWSECRHCTSVSNDDALAAGAHGQLEHEFHRNVTRPLLPRQATASALAAQNLSSSISEALNHVIVSAEESFGQPPATRTSNQLRTTPSAHDDVQLDSNLGSTAIGARGHTSSGSTLTTSEPTEMHANASTVITSRKSLLYSSLGAVTDNSGMAASTSQESDVLLTPTLTMQVPYANVQSTDASMTSLAITVPNEDRGAAATGRIDSEQRRANGLSDHKDSAEVPADGMLLSEAVLQEQKGIFEEIGSHGVPPAGGDNLHATDDDSSRPAAQALPQSAYNVLHADASSESVLVQPTEVSSADAREETVNLASVYQDADTAATLEAKDMLDLSSDALAREPQLPRVESPSAIEEPFIAGDSQTGGHVASSDRAHLTMLGHLPKREAAIMRLSNVIKTLEQNLTLTNRYLEEMSRKYRKQKEELQRTLNATIDLLNKLSTKVLVQDAVHSNEMNTLRSALQEVTEAVHNNSLYIAALQNPVPVDSISLLFFFLGIVASLLTCCRRRSALTKSEMAEMMKFMADSPPRVNTLRRCGSSDGTVGYEPPQPKHPLVKCMSQQLLSSSETRERGIEEVEPKESKPDFDIIYPLTWRTFDTPCARKVPKARMKDIHEHKISDPKVKLFKPQSTQRKSALVKKRASRLSTATLLCRNCITVSSHCEGKPSSRGRRSFLSDSVKSANHVTSSSDLSDSGENDSVGADYVLNEAYHPGSTDRSGIACSGVVNSISNGHHRYIDAAASDEIGCLESGRCDIICNNGLAGQNAAADALHGHACTIIKMCNGEKATNITIQKGQLTSGSKKKRQYYDETSSSIYVTPRESSAPLPLGRR